MKAKNILKLFVSTIIILLLLTSCSNNNITENNISASNSVSVETNEYSFLNSFINKFNTNNQITITNLQEYIASDKSNPYYKTEFRLSAFKDAKSIHATIGNSEVDMIDYSSKLYNTYYTNFRIYLKSDNITEIKEVGSIMIKLLDSTITDQEIEKAYNSMSNSFYLGNYIKGTIIKNEIMIDYSKIN